MTVFLQQVLNGLMLGGVYMLVAVSFSICWSILNVLNFSIPALFMLGGFGLWAFMDSGLPWQSAMLGAVLLAGLVSWFIERLSFRRQRSAGPLVPLVSSLGFLILIENLVLAHYGSDGRTLHLPTADANLRFGGVVLGWANLGGLVLAIALVAGLHVMVKRTRFGRGTRAVAEAPGTAVLLGLDINALVSRIFVLAGLFTSLAGVLFALSYLRVSPFIGDQVALKGLSAMVIGGMGNIWGAVVGGLLIGMAEVFSIQFLSADWVNVVVYGVLLAVIIARPSGLLGDSHAKSEKL